MRIKWLENPNIDFMGKRKIAYAVSSVLVLVGLISLLLRLTPLGSLFGIRQTWSIDFTGGRLVQVYVEAPIDQVRSATIKMGLRAEIQNVGQAHEFLIKYKEDVEPDSLVRGLERILGKKVRLDRAEHVGPKIGAELREKALILTIVGLLVILFYIWLRFDILFGLAATIALFHDVIITWGLHSLFGFETDMTVIAALLTLIGYSINDSIVVADRVREYLGRFRLIDVSPKDLERIFNDAINSTLSRTVITSFTTFIVVFSLLLFGGPVLFNFAFILTVGVFVGTYSSIFVVSSLVLDWRLRGLRRKGK
ncbi:MAG: protein translocase subunit SecF [Thermotogae bacterium]|nr:protein translocase subunit SecF [Thermotogota bacterium]